MKNKAFEHFNNVKRYTMDNKRNRYVLNVRYARINARNGAENF